MPKLRGNVQTTPQKAPSGSSLFLAPLFGLWHGFRFLPSILTQIGIQNSKLQVVKWDFGWVKQIHHSGLKLTQLDSLDSLTLRGDLNEQTMSNWLKT